MALSLLLGIEHELFLTPPLAFGAFAHHLLTSLFLTSASVSSSLK
jgi:hypothetical protein